MSELLAVDPSDVLGSPYDNISEGDPSGLVQFHPGADEAVKAGMAFADGDWATGVIALAGSGAEMASMVLDPIATLASSVAGFLLDYMPPLPQMLDALAGNPDLVEAIGDTWVNVAGAIEEAAADMDASLARVLGTWTGQSATTYAAVAGMLVDTLNKAAHTYRCIGSGLQTASGIVEAVRGLTKEIIAELVGALISWAGQVAGTAGIGASWVIPQAVSRISETVRDATKLADALTEAMRLGDTMVEQVTAAIGYLSTFLAQVREGQGQADRAGQDTA
ncbi:hypothetical protein QWY28_20735 [Nocardioides sp. SOB77]|uniref:Outer membrane channel protein CpnT-like N-terminal domain-containing protein n=1 Tax=Nocardioides oceani TaxID=3058369 RepID=A0ABT8FL40_9ACTN|nr:hypothetical protein [Nocardioides oceani]MDN4175401.1 hypothetical protein [Nocardioides oceani]